MDEKNSDRPVLASVSASERAKLLNFVDRHADKVASASKKPTQLLGDVSPLYVMDAFDSGNKEKVIMLMTYGIDVFAPYCRGECDRGQEKWIIDFYARNDKTRARDLKEEEKLAILKAYRLHKWKINLVGGSIHQFNRRKPFITFMEKYVISTKNTELREKVKNLLSIAIVQSNIAAFL